MDGTSNSPARWWGDDFLSLLNDRGPTPGAAGPSITIIDAALAAKGGVPGKPDKGGGGGDDGGDGGDGGDGSDGVHGEYLAGEDDGEDGYDILIDFKGDGWTFELQQPFIQAANYLTEVITADIGGGARYRGTTIDDLYVTAELSVIDGVGGILGRAGPTAVWSSNDLTATGVMEFDVADAQDYLDRGLFDDIVMHELMHVLGFGTLWGYGQHDDLVDGFRYIGTNALEAYNALVEPDVSYIPIEDGGGSGTAGGHWDEGALGNELMTGYIDDDGNANTNDDNYLSAFSVMSLADLGYAVTYSDYPYDDPLIA